MRGAWLPLGFDEPDAVGEGTELTAAGAAAVPHAAAASTRTTASARITRELRTATPVGSCQLSAKSYGVWLTVATRTSISNGLANDARACRPRAHSISSGRPLLTPMEGA